MEKRIHDGHRKRMREKIERFGLAFMPEHEQLEYILYSVISRGNTNEIAHKLLDRFGSIFGVLTADLNELQTISGVGLKVAEYLHGLPSILGVVYRSKLDYENNGKAELNDLNSMVEFCKSLFFDSISESVYMIYLNKARRIIRFERMNNGSMDDVYFNVGAAIHSAVLNNAYFVLLTHNHPSGDTAPSDDDVFTTNEFRKATEAVDIGFLDHIIIAGENYYSFREHRMI